MRRECRPDSATRFFLVLNCPRRSCRGAPIVPTIIVAPVGLRIGYSICGRDRRISQIYLFKETHMPLLNKRMDAPSKSTLYIHGQTLVPGQFAASASV